MPGPETNTLYYGDCLDWMQDWPDECVDLIYLDPPFNSNANYNIIFGTENGVPAQVRGFEDTWKWDRAAMARSNRIKSAVAHPLHEAERGLRTLLGPSGMLSYLTYMGERLVEMRRLLKSTGSIYLHCDDTASHYLKILMDAVFGPAQYQNDISWRRTRAHNSASRFGRVLDHVLFYAKDRRRAYWNGEATREPKLADELAATYTNEDEHGRYYNGVLTGPEPRSGRSGESWQGHDPTAYGRHWAVPRDGRYAEYIEAEFIPGYRQIDDPHERLDALDAAGLIHHPQQSGGWPTLKRYAAADQGIPPQNLILDPIGFRNFGRRAGEYLGYPTQKPLRLLEKLIAPATPPGGFVLDPFCGCGTAVLAAEQLDRRWAGVDISSFAVELIEERRLVPAGVEFSVQGIPQDMAGARKLAEDNPFDFEAWAIHRIGGLLPNQRQRGDRGVDGRGLLLDHPEVSGLPNLPSRLVVAQVKGGKRLRLGDLRDFRDAMRTEDAAFGIFITLERWNSANARVLAAEMGRIKIGASEIPRLQLWSIEQYFDGRRPQLPSLANPYTGRAMEPVLFAQQHRLGI